MSNERLTDSEVAVTIDSLSAMRDRLKANGVKSLNVEAALNKFCGLVSPDTDGLTISNERVN